MEEQLSPKGEGGESVEEHGVALNEEKSRVRCNHCGKEVRGFNRLQHHLGGVGSDVVACVQAPDDVKGRMRESLLAKKKERLLKEVGKIYHPDLPLKRNFTPPSSEAGQCQSKRTHPCNSVKKNLAADSIILKSENGDEGSFPCVPSQPASSDKGKNVMEPACKMDSVDGIGNLHKFVKEEVKDETQLVAASCVGRFFYEAGIDLRYIKLPSFQRMIDAAIKCGTGYKVPLFDELGGWILQKDFNEVQRRVEEVKNSWGRTGCSILLDGWTDQSGKSLIGFLVECPQGIVFLRSVDASDAIKDVDALVLLLGRVVEEVGVQNVVQIVAHDASSYMKAAGKKLMNKYRGIFWNLCADYCINLILEKVGMLDHVKKVLTEAKSITRFIYSHAVPLELMKKHVAGGDLVRATKLKSIASFITLENMVSEKENLMCMFSSPAWSTSVWASRKKGRSICELVKKSAFWDAVVDILKVTKPLVGVLHQINESNVAPMGIIYDTMDRAKEAIKRALGGEQAKYQPFWNMVDEVWNNYLHNPLHSAGYYLNPSLFYSGDFYIDAEVTTGLLCCTVRLGESQQSQDLIVQQLEAYRSAAAEFGEEMAINQRSTLPPAVWWSLHGSKSPELQRLAIKVLSQTCRGASRYKVRKDLSEEVHAKGRNCIEQQRFCDMEFVHNNLQLWHSSSNGDQKENIELVDLNPMDDWILGG